MLNAFYIYFSKVIIFKSQATIQENQEIFLFL